MVCRHKFQDKLFHKCQKFRYPDMTELAALWLFHLSEQTTKMEQNMRVIA